MQYTLDILRIYRTNLLFNPPMHKPTSSIILQQTDVKDMGL